METRRDLKRRLAGGLLRRLGSRPVLVLMSGLIIGLNAVTGPFLQFPVLFVAPVTLAAARKDSLAAYGLSVLLPLARLATANYVEFDTSPGFLILNALIRIVVLALLGVFILRSARQADELEAQFQELVTICSWSRTVEFEGEWITFEEYLERRFNQHSTHGISPNEAAKMRGDLQKVKESKAIAGDRKESQ